MRNQSKAKIVAIQTGAISFLDEGIEQVLDTFEERACVNTVMPAVFSFSRGTAGRHKPFPGHGKNVEDTNFRGGNFATVHPQYYHDTGIDPMLTQSPDHPGFDVLAQVLPAARKRGMKVIALVQNSFREDLPGFDKLRERDFNGQGAETACVNNPYHRNFLMGLVDDVLSSYEIDGIMYVHERQGAFSDTLGSRFRGKARGLPGERTCFCPYCEQKARKFGVRFDRVRPAFEELEEFVKAGRRHQRPVDGYYVTLWRLLLRYPELLVWEHFYHESSRELYRLLRTRTKAARPAAEFGLHIWTNHSMSPIYRAEQDSPVLAECADFLKIALYHNCGGPRLASYIDSVGETIYGDVPREELLQFHYRVLNYEGEAPYDGLRQAGLSDDYVYRESKRALDGQPEGGPSILAGIDVDIPIHEADLDGFDPDKTSRTTRAGVRGAVSEALRAGVHGIVISRKYSEMKLDNLSGVGDAIRESGLKT